MKTLSNPLGDYQFDVYRLMKGATGGAWSRFHPITNVLVRFSDSVVVSSQLI